MKDLSLDILDRRPGRILYVQQDGTLFLSRHYKIYRSISGTSSWEKTAVIPRSLFRRFAEPSRMACRVLRHEVRAFLPLEDGFVASNREGVFWCDSGNKTMRPATINSGDLNVWPPMNITAGPIGTVVWGEYGGSNEHTRQVRLFASNDYGKSYEVCHVFDSCEIRHVHNLLYDRSIDSYWVMVGDHDSRPGIGLLSSDFASFHWVQKGKQIFRAVCAFDLGDRLLYGTDTEMEPNAVISLDKHTGKTERIAEMPGSCIYACRFGKHYVISTSVEPSPVNQSRDATLWLSRDGDRWEKVFSAAKDRWDEKYFQFGSLVLPKGGSENDAISFSGQALRGIDGQTCFATVCT